MIEPGATLLLDTIPPIAPDPFPEPDFDPETDPDPDPVLPPVSPDPGIDPGFPIDPFPSPLVTRGQTSSSVEWLQ